MVVSLIFFKMMVVEKGVVAVEIGKRFVVQNFHRFAIAGHRVIQTEHLASMAVDDIQVVREIRMTDIFKKVFWRW